MKYTSENENGRIWYAAQENEMDDSWDGEGSENLEEAEDIARRMGPDARVAVIDCDENGIGTLCIDVIEQEDF